MPPEDRPSQSRRKHAVAGVSAGCVTVLTLHPLDVIKTRLQVQDGLPGSSAYRGALNAASTIVREEGLRGLYAGLTPALLGSGLAWGIYFFSYDRAKVRWTRWLEEREAATAGAPAGASVPAPGAAPRSTDAGASSSQAAISEEPLDETTREIGFQLGLQPPVEDADVDPRAREGALARHPRRRAVRGAGGEGAAKAVPEESEGAGPGARAGAGAGAGRSEPFVESQSSTGVSSSGRGGEPSARPPIASTASPLVHLAAAVEAGITVALLTNPIWVVKTRMQLQKPPKDLFVGLEKRLVVGSAKGPWGFSAKELLARFLRGGAATGAAEAGAMGGVGGAGGMGAGASVGPRLLSRFPPLLGLAPLSAPAAAPPRVYRGFFHALGTIAREEGVRGLYRGLAPSLVLVSHGAVQFAAYEELKGAFKRAKRARMEARGEGGATTETASVVSSSGGGEAASSSQSSSSSSGPATGAPASSPSFSLALSPLEITTAGALSKVLATMVTYPSQVIRSRMQQLPRDPSMQGRYAGLVAAARNTARGEGVWGFYRGLAPNLARVAPQSAITLLVYESVLGWLQ